MGTIEQSCVYENGTVNLRQHSYNEKFNDEETRLNCVIIHAMQSRVGSTEVSVV